MESFSQTVTMSHVFSDTLHTAHLGPGHRPTQETTQDTKRDISAYTELSTIVSLPRSVMEINFQLIINGLRGWLGGGIE